MRTLAFITAIVVVAILPATALGASGTPPVLAHGFARDAHGSALRSTVLLFHDNLRDRNRLELIGQSRTGLDGSYRLAFAGNQATDDAASRNDGYVNFMVMIRSATRSGVHFFAKRLTDAGWQDGDGDRAITVTAKQRLSPETARATKSLQAAGPEYDWLGNCPYDEISSFKDWVPVIEAHSWTDMTVNATYGEGFTADSSISVGVKNSSGWGIEGSNHIGNTTSVEHGVLRTGKTGYVWESQFEFKRYQSDASPYSPCGAGPDQIIEATKWLPDAEDSPRPAWNDSRFDGQCTTTYSAYRSRRTPGTAWARASERFTAFGWKLTSPIVSMTSRSGSSARVTLRYTIGTSPISHYICGSNALPSTALRVFAGH